MKNFVPLDPETGVSAQRWAVVYVPKRSRKRFPASCVEVVDSQTIALDRADPSKKHYAASVLGPSKSSEGQSIYYLAQWLGARP